MLKSDNPVEKESTEQVVQRKYLSANRVEPDKMGKTKYCTGKHCAWNELCDPGRF
jgi:hypothetical protein